MAKDNHMETELIAWLQGDEMEPDDLTVYSTRGCQNEKSSKELFDASKRKAEDAEDHDAAEEIRQQSLEKTLEQSAGRGHGATLDQSSFTFSLKNWPRLVTLFLCAPQYAEHLQLSLRFVDASSGFSLTPQIMESGLADTAEKLMLSAFDLYSMMKEAGVPEEDARFHLPLGTNTNITTKVNARALMQMHYDAHQQHFPSWLGVALDDMLALGSEVAPMTLKTRKYSHERLAWLPSSQLFAIENMTIQQLALEHKGDCTLIGSSKIPMSDAAVEYAVKERDAAELANLKHTHYTFLAKMSLTAFHQATRQRTWDQSVESIYDAIIRGGIKMPRSISRSSFNREYQEQNQAMLDLYMDLVISGVEGRESLCVLPHSLMVYDLIHMNGWNAIHSIGKRTCVTAQWEIRHIARKMAEAIKADWPGLGKFTVPQGINYGECPERKNCDYCDAFLGKDKL